MEQVRWSWGITALIQGILFTIFAGLLIDAIHHENNINVEEKIGENIPFLKEISYFVVESIIPRLQIAFESIVVFDVISIPNTVSLWATLTLLGNISSALFLLYICAKTLDQNHKYWRVMVILLLAISIVFSIFGAPLFYSEVKFEDGQYIPVNISLLSIFIFGSYFLTDIVSSATTSVRSDSYNFLVLAFGVSLPLMAATIAFWLCAMFGQVDPAFSIGVSSALLAVNSVSILILSILFWTKSDNGERILRKSKITSMFVVQFIFIGAFLNAGLGFLVQYFGAPLYIDTVGSIAIAWVFGVFPGIISAFLGSIILGSFTTWTSIAYVGTAVLVTWMAGHLKNLENTGFLSEFGVNPIKTVFLGGLLLGPASSIVSIPVTVWLFGGETGVETDRIAAFFYNMTDSLLQGVATGAFLIDALDKSITVFCSWILISVLYIHSGFSNKLKTIDVDSVG